MIIVFFGDNDFITKRKLKEALKNYKEKHKSGLSFFSFSSDNFSFDKFKDAVETSSMFDEKKCIVLNGVFSSDKFKKSIVEYIEKNSVKSDEDTIIIFVEGDLSEKEKDSDWLIQKPSMVYESKKFSATALKTWVQKEVASNKASIEEDAAVKLISYCKGDLWRLENEIAKLSLYNKKITASAVDLLVSHNDGSDIFKAIESLAKKNKKEATDIFYKQIADGKSIPYILSMVSFQFRNLLKVKEFSEDGLSSQDIAKKTKLHPFVVTKSQTSSKNFSLAELKNIYKKVLEVDLKTKTSSVDPLVFLDEFILSL